MARRAKPGWRIVVPRGFPAFDPKGLRLFGDRGKPLLSTSMLEMLDERRHLLGPRVTPVSEGGEPLLGMALKELLSSVMGSRQLKSVDPQATLDRALEALDRVHGSVLFDDDVLSRPFSMPETVPASDLRLQSLPMSARLRRAWEVLLDDPDSAVSDTLAFSMRDLRVAGGGWAVPVEWGVLLEHFCVDPESFALFQDARSAPDLETVSRYVAEELIRADGSRLDVAWVDAIRRRKGWGRPRVTLDAIGIEMGVTRERIRQIEARLVDHNHRLEWPMPEVVGEALGVAQDPNISEESFGAELMTAGLARDSSWDRKSLAEMLGVLGRRTDAESVRDGIAAAMQESARARSEDLELLGHVRRARSHMGFLNLAAVVDGAGIPIPDDRVRAVVGRKYPRVASFEGWVLAGVEMETAAENAALAQLGVAQPLPAQVLVDGLDRVARKRQDLALPPAAVVISLLSRVGCLSVDDRMASPLAPVALPEPGSNDRWLYELLIDQPDESMHVDDVLRIARADDRSEASITVHLTYSPIVRRAQGVVSLVGADLDPEVRAKIKRVANAKRVDSDYTVEWTDRGPVVTLTMGTAYLTSTVVGMRQDLLGNTKVVGLGTTCCPGYRSDGKLGISGATAVYGWTSLFRHWVSAHHVSEGDQVRVLLGDSVVSTLEPWAYAVVDAQAAAASAPVVGPARDSEIVDDADEPALWSLPAVSVQLGIPSLEEGVPSSGQQDEASPELGLSNPSVSRRSGAAGSPEHASTLWDVPVQGALELGRRDASREGGESLDVEPGSWRREFVADTPEPGSLSLRPRGDVRLTLSVARSEILLSRDGTSLNERHGAAAEELAKAWLRIRPSGGRIWVDEDGFATTLVGGELLSLGRVPTGWVLE